jgi:xylulokinase
MFVESLEVAFQRLKQQNVDFSRVQAISTSGQQHGSVWWAQGAGALLAGCNAKPEVPLHEVLKGAFSLPAAPIWMDSSTAAECKEIEAQVLSILPYLGVGDVFLRECHLWCTQIGGPAKVAELSGSRAYERFTGPQIRKYMKTRADMYAHTERIGLISSLIPSLLTSQYAAIDYSDGAGMNLMGT